MTSIDRSSARRIAFGQQVASARPWACAVAMALAGCQTPPSTSTGNASSDAAALAARYPTQPNCKRLARTNTTENATIGAAVGAGLGALIGSKSNAPQGTRNGALIGAVTGAVAGSQFNSALGLTELPDGSVKVNVPGGVLFHTGSADINPAFQQTLVQFSAVLRDFCGVTATVVGHTDSVGSYADNQRLSERRAQAVTAYLRQQNVDAGRLFAEGKSSSMPIADNASEAGRSQNRRVEITVRPPAG